MKNYISTALIALLVGIGIGYIFFHQPKNEIASAVAVGTTNSSQRIAQIVANNTSSATYVSGAVGSGIYTQASITNNDTNDRVITGIDYYFDGLTTIATSTATLNLQAATSSDSTTLNSNTNYLLYTTVATSTPVLFVGSTTPGLAGTNANRIWKAGSAVNFITNGTTTGNLIVKINYIAE